MVIQGELAMGMLEKMEGNAKEAADDYIEKEKEKVKEIKDKKDKEK